MTTHNTTYINRPWFVLILALTTLTSVQAAESLSANNLSEDDFFGDIPVVLTATRLAQPISEAPAAITIIDRQMILASGEREIADLFRMVPGFVVSRDNGYTPIVSYHGLSDEYAVRLQVLIDGRSVYSPVFGGVDWANLPLAMDDIERIEIIRGPNAASYGSNSFLSIINIITQHAAETTGTFVRGIRGSNGIRDVYARYGDTTGDFNYRVTASRMSDNGFAARADNRRMKNARFRGDYQVNGRDNLMFQAGVTRATHEVDSKRLDSVTNRKANINFEQIRWQRQIGNNDSLSLQFFHTLEKNEQVFDVTLSPAIRIVADSSTTSERFDFELQHTKQLQENMRMVWGLGLRQDSAKGLQIFGTDPATGYSGNKKYFYNQLGRLFGNIEWRLKHDLTLNLGSMWEKSTLADPEFSPRLGLNYSMTPEHAIRMIVSRATRTPSLNEARSNFRIPVETPSGNLTSTVWVGNQNIQPERITSYELAYHATLIQKKLSFDLKRYREKFRDLITLDGNTIANPADPLLNGYEIYDNLTDARVDGVEANLDFSPLVDTRIIVSRTSTRIKSENPNISSAQLASSAPRHITSLLAINRFPGGVTGSMLFYSVGESNGLGSGDRVAGYQRVNLRLAFPLRWPGISAELALVIQNATGNYIDWRDDNVAETQQYISFSAQWD